jgi:hypothetical protein
VRVVGIETAAAAKGCSGSQEERERDEMNLHFCSWCLLMLVVNGMKKWLCGLKETAG